MDYKSNSYHLVFIIINILTKIVYYKLVKVTINELGLVKIINNIIVRYYGFLNLIVINQRSFFISKFLLLLCYFFVIK